jgi:hypothetical protein
MAGRRKSLKVEVETWELIKRWKQETGETADTVIRRLLSNSLNPAHKDQPTTRNGYRIGDYRLVDIQQLKRCVSSPFLSCDDSILTSTI